MITFKCFTIHFILDGDLKDMNQMLLKMKTINRLIFHMNNNYIYIYIYDINYKVLLTGTCVHNHSY